MDNPSEHLSYTNLDAHQSLPEVASFEEIQECLKELRRQVDSTLGRRQFDPIRKRNLALFSLMYATGIRAGEVLISYFVMSFGRNRCFVYGLAKDVKIDECPLLVKF